jgi:hypothetical protein
MGAIAAAIAIGAADEDVAQELHLDLLEARAAASFALPLTGVEAEGAGIESALLGLLGLGEDGPDVVERAYIDRRIRARGLAEDGLIHQDDAAEVFGTLKNCGVPVLRSSTAEGGRNAECGFAAFGFAIAFR